MQIQLIYTNGILYVNSIPSYHPRLADDALRHCLDSSNSLLLFFPGSVYCLLKDYETAYQNGLLKFDRESSAMGPV